MPEAVSFMFDQPALAWLAVAALLLAVEVATGTGWLLWAAGAAGAVCVALLALSFGLAWQVVLFAVLTIASSLVGRRLWPAGGAGEDINDNAARLIGRQARVVAAFDHGRGRVAIDGKEWAASLVAGADPALDGFVEVVAASGAELSVRSTV